MMEFIFSKQVKKHKKNNLPVLALESTIIAHGMPYPESYHFAKKVEIKCREKGVAPATIAILDGQIHVGLNDKNLKRVCRSKEILKLSKRDIPFALATKQSGATTVSATAWIAFKAGIFVFSTGGIGGVHRNVENHFDVSQDLKTLSDTPIIVISAGAKSILDLPKTVERLETLGVPIVGYKTSFFPAFYTRSSGIKINSVVRSEKQIALLYLEHLKTGLGSSLFVVNPISKKDEISQKKIDSFISAALSEAQKQKVCGKDLTPFLLKNIAEKTKGDSLKANISLAKNNVSLGAKIAQELSIHVGPTPNQKRKS